MYVVHVVIGSYLSLPRLRFSVTTPEPQCITGVCGNPGCSKVCFPCPANLIIPILDSLLSQGLNSVKGKCCILALSSRDTVHQGGEVGAGE